MFYIIYTCITLSWECYYAQKLPFSFIAHPFLSPQLWLCSFNLLEVEELSLIATRHFLVHLLICKWNFGMKFYLNERTLCRKHISQSMTTVHSPVHFHWLEKYMKRIGKILFSRELFCLFWRWCCSTEVTERKHSPLNGTYKYEKITNSSLHITYQYLY